MPYQCVNCKQRFRQTGDLKRHREFQKCGFTQDDFYNNSDEPANRFRNAQQV